MKAEPLINFFKDKKISGILDVGTGSGNFIPVLKQTFPEAEITGIDIDEGALVSARQKFPEITFLRMQAEKLLFKDNSFDVVSISMTLHHLPKVKRGLKEMKRVVKNEGWIIINETISNDLNPAQQVHKMYHHFRSRIDTMKGICHRKSFTKDTIIQMLKTADIQIQFFFENKKNINLIENKTDLDIWVSKMKQMLEQIKGRPEYDIMKPEIQIFRKNALRYGIQPSTNLIIAGRKKKLN
jgi:ubiquinone/menaquinone biosynthesis C-methylase UbiE